MIDGRYHARVKYVKKKNFLLKLCVSLPVIAVFFAIFFYLPLLLLLSSSSFEWKVAKKREKEESFIALDSPFFFLRTTHPPHVSSRSSRSLFIWNDELFWHNLHHKAHRQYFFANTHQFSCYTRTQTHSVSFHRCVFQLDRTDHGKKEDTVHTYMWHAEKISSSLNFDHYSLHLS